MIVLLALATMVLSLAAIFLFGWFVFSPIIEWLGHRLFALSIKGHEYRALTKKEKAGQVQDQTT